MQQSGSNDSHRYEALDSLRGICACMIVLYHFDTPGMISRSTFVQNSFLFVDFFFVLSGFVISASYGKRLQEGFSIAKFMGLRLGRIYPLHFAILMIFLAFEILYASGAIGSADRHAFHIPNDPYSFAASLALIQTFLPNFSQGWNNPSWSIQVEIWTYLLFAFMFRWAGKYLIPAALLLGMICAVYVYQLSDRYLNVNQQGAFARCIYGFSLGVIAFQLKDRLIFIGRFEHKLATLLECVTVAVAIALITGIGASPWSMIIPPFFFIVILVFARQGGMVSRFLTFPGPRLLGTLSFSIYMIHRFLIYRVLNILSVIDKLSHQRLSLVIHRSGSTLVSGGWLTGDVMSVAFLTLVIGCSYLSYHLIERPAQRWSRQRILGPHPRGAVLAAEREAPTF